MDRVGGVVVGGRLVPAVTVLPGRVVMIVGAGMGGCAARAQQRGAEGEDREQRQQRSSPVAPAGGVSVLHRIVPP